MANNVRPPRRILTIVNLVFFIKACLASSETNQAELGQVKPAESYAPQQPDGYPAQQPQPVYGGQQPYATQ